METANDIVDHIGRERVADLMGIQPSAVYEALRRNKLPSSWYLALCREVGQTLPATAFAFKGMRK